MLTVIYQSLFDVKEKTCKIIQIQFECISSKPPSIHTLLFVYSYLFINLVNIEFSIVYHIHFYSFRCIMMSWWYKFLQFTNVFVYIYLILNFKNHTFMVSHFFTTILFKTCLMNTYFNTLREKYGSQF